MSRLGKLAIKIPSGVSISPQGQHLLFKGPKGEFLLRLNPAIEIKPGDQEIIVSPRNPEAKDASALWGLMWSLTNNAVIGVSVGFQKQLEVNGVGYRAAVSGDKLNLNLGFSHPVEFKIPAGIKATVAGNVITLEGVDKALVGETASQIKNLRRPEPYKGKGIKYVDEIIRRKAGKAAAKGK